MKLWRAGSGGDDGPDADLQFLSQAQARLVRRLFREAMTGRGRELVADVDGNLRDAQGSFYGLWNVAVLCRDHPGGENEWPDLLSRVLGTDAPHGVLAAMPARHWAFIHVLADKTATRSLLKLAAMARIAYGQEQEPISPDVFWWRDGDWMLVPSVESGGKLTLRPGPELSFLITDLAARRPRD